MKTKHVFSDQFVNNYLLILDEFRPIVKKSFTKQELASILDISRPVLDDFLNEKSIRVDLLDQIAALSGCDLELKYYKQKHNIFNNN